MIALHEGSRRSGWYEKRLSVLATGRGLLLLATATLVIDGRVL